MKTSFVCAISAVLFVSALSAAASAQEPVPMTPPSPTAGAAPNQEPGATHSDAHETPHGDPSRLEPAGAGDRRWLGTRLMIAGGGFLVGSVALCTTGAVVLERYNASYQSDVGPLRGKGITGVALLGGGGLSAILGFTLLAVGGSLRRSSGSAALSIGPRGASATFRF